MKKTLVLFSGGKDSSLALLHELQKNNNCAVLIIMNDHDVQMSDGPEASTTLVTTLATELFEVKDVFYCKTTDTGYLSEVVMAVDTLIEMHGFTRIVTGDLGHPLSIIYVLEKALSQKYPLVLFTSIFEEYKDSQGVFQTQKYIKDITDNFSVLVSGVRLPDFEHIGEPVLGEHYNNAFIELVEEQHIDPVGEDGEFQTIVTGIKNAKKEIVLFRGAITVSPGRGNNKFQYKILELSYNKN